MAAGKTAQLTASTLSLSGTAIDALDSVTYTSSDSSRVRVSATGLLTAATGPDAVTSGPVTVTVTARKNGVTRTTTAYVAVVETEGTNPRFTIRTPSDTAVLSVASYKYVDASVSYTVGGSEVDVPSFNIPLVIRVTPSNYGTLQSPNSFQVTHASDTIHVYATVNVFGTTLSDSTQYPLGDASVLYLSVSGSGLKYSQGDGTAPFNTSTVVYLRVGGTVWFQNSMWGSSYTIGVSFEPSNGGAAIPPVTGLSMDAVNYAVVTFDTPGTYKYTWTGDATTLLPANQIGSTIVVR
jgi:hypothetical protein